MKSDTLRNRVVSNVLSSRHSKCFDNDKIHNINAEIVERRNITLIVGFYCLSPPSLYSLSPLPYFSPILTAFNLPGHNHFEHLLLPLATNNHLSSSKHEVT